MEAFGVGSVIQLAGEVVGYVPRLRDWPQWPVPKFKPCRHNFMYANHESVLVISQRSEMEVVVVLYCYTLGALSIYAVESKEKSGREYGLLVAREGGWVPSGSGSSQTLLARKSTLSLAAIPTWEKIPKK